MYHLNQPPGTLFPQVFQVVVFIHFCTAINGSAIQHHRHSQHEDEGQPDARKSQEAKVISFEATWGIVDEASIRRMTVQSRKDLIRSSPESKHLGVTGKKEVLQSRAHSFIHADAGVGTNSLMSDE